MKTPKEYTRNLKNGIITEDMIVDCLYSVNKRAKNYRDKAYQYRYSYYHGDSQREEMERYYGYKEQLLSYFTPKCIHQQYVGRGRERVYDYGLNITTAKAKISSGKIAIMTTTRTGKFGSTTTKPM